MAKQLRQWLDEFVNNGADPKNVIEWPSDAGGSIKVTELPEVGKENTIYELEDTIFNWFGHAFYKTIIQQEEEVQEIQKVMSAGEVAVFESYDNFPEINNALPFFPYLAFDTKKVYRFNDSIRQYEELIQDESHTYTIISDFTEETVTLLDGTVEQWKIFQDGIEHIYIYLYQSNNYLYMRDYVSGCCKHYYEVRMIDSIEELPEQPEESFIQDAEEYSYYDYEGYNYSYNYADGEWQKDDYSYSIRTSIPTELGLEYILNCTDLNPVTKYIYENNEWIDVSDVFDNIKFKPIEKIKITTIDNNTYLSFVDPNDYSSLQFFHEVSYHISINEGVPQETYQTKDILVSGIAEGSNSIRVDICLSCHNSTDKEIIYPNEQILVIKPQGMLSRGQHSMVYKNDYSNGKCLLFIGSDYSSNKISQQYKLDTNTMTNYITMKTFDVYGGISIDSPIAPEETYYIGGKGTTSGASSYIYQTSIWNFPGERVPREIPNVFPEEFSQKDYFFQNAISYNNKIYIFVSEDLFEYPTTVYCFDPATEEPCTVYDVIAMPEDDKPYNFNSSIIVGSDVYFMKRDWDAADNPKYCGKLCKYNLVTKTVTELNIYFPVTNYGGYHYQYNKMAVGYYEAENCIYYFGGCFDGGIGEPTNKILKYDVENGILITLDVTLPTNIMGADAVFANDATYGPVFYIACGQTDYYSGGLTDIKIFRLDFNEFL